MFKFHSYILRHKAIALTVGFLFLALISFLASRIELEEDITSLIPSGERQDVLLRVLDHTEFQDRIIVTISSTTPEPDPDAITAYAQQFLDSVNLHLPQYFNDIQGQVPEEGIREVYNFVYSNLPLFLNENDYREIENRLHRDSIRIRLQENYKILMSPTGLVTKDYLFRDPLSITTLGLRKLEELQVDDDFELYNNFLMTRDQQHVLLFISPSLPASETNQNLEFINRLEAIQQQLDAEYTNVKGEFFGGVLYSIANATQIKRDIQLTLSIAAGILLLILIFYYRRLYVPLVLFIPSLIGGVTAIALLYLLKGTVSAISLGIGGILLGISIDYSLHILTHYKNNNDLKKLYREVTGPVIMSSTTTAIAFLCLLFVRSEALNDLGIFAAISVVVASFFALILIPLLYKTPKATKVKITFIDRIAAIDFHRKPALVYTLGILFVAGLFFFTGVKFNYDLSALNYEPEDIREKERNIQEIAGRAAKSIYLVSYGNSVDEALEHNHTLYRELTTLESEGKITNYSSIGGVVLSTNTQLERIEQWNEFWSRNRVQQVQENLVRESQNFGFRPQSFRNFYNMLAGDFEPIYLEDYRNTSTLYLDDFISAGDDFATVTTSVNVPQENLPGLLDNFQQMENVVIVDRQQLNESFLGNLKNDFNRLIGYSIVAVFFVLLLFYRSLELTILTLLPIGITWVIALGIMAAFGIEFNILNIIISTFIFGLGLDYSIFITNAFLKEYSTGTTVIKTYRTSILLSVFTTLLGIGSLFFARHPALQSISIVSIIGVVTAVLVAFVLQTFIFQKLFLDRKRMGKPAFNIRGAFNLQGDKLYNKQIILENYTFKTSFSEVKNEFEAEKERYLKVAEFLEEGDKVLQLNSGWGVLPLFLFYKNETVTITGVEPQKEMYEAAINTFASNSQRISFQEEIVEVKDFDVVIISAGSGTGNSAAINDLITKKVKRVVVLDPSYSYRWLVDLNFEINYRQNDVVLLHKIDY